MKRHLLYLLSIVLLASCSTQQKYAYNFDYYNYKSTKKSDQKTDVAATLSGLEIEAKSADLLSNPDELIAAKNRMVSDVDSNPMVARVAALADKYAGKSDLSTKTERKDARKEMKRDLKSLKKDLKKYIKEKKGEETIQSTKAMDNDLKLGLIFLIAAALTSWIFWPLGVVLWIVGLIFLIMWLAKQ